MKLLCILNFILASLICNSQVIDSVTLNKVRRNILAYHIRYSLPYDFGLKEDGYLYEREKYKFERLIPSGDLKLKIEFSPCNALSYPLSDYKLFELKKSGFSFYDQEGKGYHFRMSSFSCDEKYLIGIDENTKQIKYISGAMFLHDISDDFRFEEEKDFIDFINIKLYNYEFTDIEFVKKRRRIMFFKAFSKALNENMVIQIDTKNDYTTVVKSTKKTITY